MCKRTTVKELPEVSVEVKEVFKTHGLRTIPEKTTVVVGNAIVLNTFLFVLQVEPTA